MRTRTGEFGIYPRHLQGTTIFYFWIYDTDGRRKYRSTGKKTYDEALKYCRSLQIKGQLYRSTSYAFDTFTTDFFIFDKCPYIRNRLLRGFSYGRTWAQKQRSLLEKIITPHFIGIDIRNITSLMIDDFVLELRQSNHGAKTINHILTTLKIIFKYAEQNRIIQDNPAGGIKPFKITTSEKGIFMREELIKLFRAPEQSGLWSNPMHFLLNYLAATTGLRLGEILALRTENIVGNTIIIQHSWNRLDGLKCTKTGKNRIVPISSELCRTIQKYLSNKNISGYIFSANDGNTPIDHKTVYKHFWDALSKIGINLNIRKERNISFHSYRHTFNTMLLEAGVHPETVRMITGHSAAMTAHYAHLQLSNMPKVLEALTIIDEPLPVSLQIVEQKRRINENETARKM
jgi:integrase